MLAARHRRHRLDEPGLAVDEPELVRDLYAVAAERRLAQGRTSHYAMALATDLGLVDASVVTDWRMTNLSASRAWPALGFRPTFFRLHRAIA